MSKHILFVEDNETQRDMFGTAVKDWNAKHGETGRTFTFDTTETVEAAQAALDRLRCDAALFDLRVRSEGGGRAEPKGNELAKIALRERGIPVAIISANTGELEEEVRNAGAVEVFDKNDEAEGGNYYDRALAWLGEQWDMMEVLAAARRTMDASAADIFLLRLWPRWRMFADLETDDRAELERIVTRQYVSHMADMLGLDDPANVSWHPFENYVSPALMSARAHTGDIFRLDGTLWLVLTPQCDMATQKVENAILARCVQGIPSWAANVAAFRAKASNNSVEKSTKFLEKFLNQNLEPSKHFLPPLPGEAEPVLVNFSNIITMPLDDLNASLEHRIASIATPFLSNIVQRFGSYISRTGQPNIDKARL
jgi:CheY-like chemotaxis protein